MVGTAHTFDPAQDPVEPDDPFGGLGGGEIKPDVTVPSGGGETGVTEGGEIGVTEGGEIGAPESKVARMDVPVVEVVARVENPEVVAKAGVEVPVVAKVIEYVDILVSNICFVAPCFCL